MVDQKFVDKIEELRHHTHSRITDLQKNLCPMVRTIYLHYQFEYWYDGYKYNIWEDDTHLYAVNEIPYCYDNNIKNTVFMDTLDNLVAEDKVWPFLFFINGEAIPWSKILIIHDYDYSYMKINGYAPDESFYTDIIVFPIGSKKILYGEDNNILIGVERKGFYFNELGHRIENVDFADIAIRLEIVDKDIYYKEVDIKNLEKDLSFENLPDGFIPSRENVLFFDLDGRFIHNGSEIELLDTYNGAYSTFRLAKDPKITNAKYAILMYNTSHTKSVSYLYDKSEDLHKPSVQDFIKKIDPDSPDWEESIDPLIRRFDFEHDKLKDYDTNIENATKYITNYDFRLWRDSFIEGFPMKSFTYTGIDFKNLADNKGYVHLSRRHSDLVEDMCMMFVNSRLYKYTIDITYTTNTMNLPIFGITDDDHVEVLIFTRCNNNILDIKVDAINTPVYIHPEYDINDCFLMTSDCPDAVYNIPDTPDGSKQFVIDAYHIPIYNFLAHVDGSKLIMDDEEAYVRDTTLIIPASSSSTNYYYFNFANPYYYGKLISLVPKNQFRYYQFKQKAGEFKIVLPAQFNYCHDPNRFMIFINGKRIDRTDYTITFMSKDRPFNRLIVYLSTVLDEGDYVDIFYLPEVFKESFKLPSMTLNGLIKLDEPNNYPKTYPLSKYTTLTFINGMKVNPLEIRDVDQNCFLINVDKYKRDENGNIIVDGQGRKLTNPYHINSIYNVVIMEYVTGDKHVAGYMSGLYDQIPEGSEYIPELIDFTKTASDDWKKYVTILFNKYKGGTIVVDEGTVDDTNNILIFVNDEASILDTTLYIVHGSDGAIGGLQKIYGTLYAIEDIEDDYKNYFGAIRSVIYDAVLDYYLESEEATTGEPFVYDFETQLWTPYGESDMVEIPVVPDKDKLVDYQLSENSATEPDVYSGKEFDTI